MYNIETTKEFRIINELKQIGDLAQSGVNGLQYATDYAYNLFWFHGESPIDKMEAFGTQALKMFQDHSEASLFIKTKNPDYEIKQIPAGYSIAWNQDGSGVMTYEAPVEEVTEE